MEPDVITGLLTSCPTLGVLVYVVHLFLNHMKEKDATTKEMAESIKQLNMTLVSIQSEGKSRDTLIDKLGGAVDELSDTLKRVKCLSSI